MSPIAAPLLAWYDAHRRDLPWRRTSDPWAILVSEVMLQQTRVEVVEEYWRRFLARFETPAALAAASDEALLEHWAGLGYYRRARFLRAAAAAVVERHGGRFPADHDALLALPGVGRYTAGAVASIAFGLPRPVVDGNVARVLSRLFLVEGDPTRGATARRLWELAEEHLDRTRPGDFNQAVMELGAVVCRPKAPRCEECPIASACRARRDGAIDRFPTPKARRAPVDVRVAAAVLRRADEVGLVRRAASARMAGLLDLPALELAPRSDAPRRLSEWLRATFDVSVPRLSRVGTARHGITHHRIEVEVYEAEVAPGTEASPPRGDPSAAAPHRIAAAPDAEGLRWVRSDDLPRLGLSALGRKILAAAADA